jgi:hypothetical protein
MRARYLSLCHVSPQGAGSSPSRLRTNQLSTAELRCPACLEQEGNAPAGCSKNPDFSPAQPWRYFHPPALSMPIQTLRPGTRLIPCKAAASNQRWFFRACLSMLSCGGSNESPAARWVWPFQFSPPLFRGVAKVALYCAHRTSTVSSCAFCEQEGHLAAPSPAGELFQHPARMSALIRDSQSKGKPRSDRSTPWRIGVSMVLWAVSGSVSTLGSQPTRHIRRTSRLRKNYVGTPALH